MTNTELLKIFGTNLKKFRKNKNYSRIRLAQMAEISPAFYANLENGMKGASLPVVLRLAQALDVSVDSLLHEWEEDAALNSIIRRLHKLPKHLLPGMERMVQLFASEYNKHRS